MRTDSLWLLATDGEGAGVGGKGQGPPTEPWNPGGAWWDMWRDFANQTYLVCIALIFVAAGMLLTFIVLDHNRGEAGIASSDQARITKFCIGVIIVGSAPVLTKMFMLTNP